MADLISPAISTIALVVSVIVFVDNRRHQAIAARLARQPALVFVWDPPNARWMLSNIGNGPALDVVILQRIDGAWLHPLRMPELGVDRGEPVPRRWVEAWSRDPGLGARYRSITGETLSTETANDASRISTSGAAMSFDADRIEPHWRYEGDRGGEPQTLDS